MWHEELSGISAGFPVLSRSYRQVAHVLLTHPPLIPQASSRRIQLASCARLACIRHAASVRPEPRSNSPKKFEKNLSFFCYILKEHIQCSSAHTGCSVQFSRSKEIKYIMVEPSGIE